MQVEEKQTSQLNISFDATSRYKVRIAEADECISYVRSENRPNIEVVKKVRSWHFAGRISTAAKLNQRASQYSLQLVKRLICVRFEAD